MAVGGSRLIVGPEGHAISMMSITLSSDARVISDDLAAHFARVFKDNMENPLLMLSAAPQPVSSERGNLDDPEAVRAVLFAR